MSYVNMMGNVHWTEQMHQQASESILREDVTQIRERVLKRRILSVFAKTLSILMPPAPTDGSADPYADVRPLVSGMAAHFVPLTAAAMQELGAAMSKMAGLDDIAAQARSDSALLDNALDYEAIRAQRDALTPLPVPDPVTGITPPDTLTADERAEVEQQRSTLQAELDAYDQSTKDLVAQRDAYRAPPADATGTAPT